MTDRTLPMWGVSPKPPIAGEVADLASLAHDFAFVAELCHELLSNSDSEPPVRRGLWEAVVISYNRAFVEGRGHGEQKRLRLPQGALDVLSDELRETPDLLT